MGNHNPDPWRRRLFDSDLHRRSPAPDVRLESERAEQQAAEITRLRAELAAVIRARTDAEQPANSVNASVNGQKP